MVPVWGEIDYVEVACHEMGDYVGMRWLDLLVGRGGKRIGCTSGGGDLLSVILGAVVFWKKRQFGIGQGTKGKKSSKGGTQR